MSSEGFARAVGNGAEPNAFPRHVLVGRSPCARRVLDLIEKVGAGRWPGAHSWRNRNRLRSESVATVPDGRYGVHYRLCKVIGARSEARYLKRSPPSKTPGGSWPLGLEARGQSLATPRPAKDAVEQPSHFIKRWASF